MPFPGAGGVNPTGDNVGPWPDPPLGLTPHLSAHPSKRMPGAAPSWFHPPPLQDPHFPPPRVGVRHSRAGRALALRPLDVRRWGKAKPNLLLESECFPSVQLGRARWNAWAFYKSLLELRDGHEKCQLEKRKGEKIAARRDKAFSGAVSACKLHCLSFRRAQNTYIYFSFSFLAGFGAAQISFCSSGQLFVFFFNPLHVLINPF